MKKLQQTRPVRRIAADFACGTLIGASMLIPGVSGGTMAILLGIYDRLVAGVSGLLREPKRSLLLLATVALGGAVGMACFSGLLLSLAETYEKPMLFLFMGAVLGSVPLMVYKAQVHSFHLDIPLFVLAGLMCALLLGTIPTNLIRPDPDSLTGYLLIFGAGLVLSVALVLPGISASYLLLVLGLYQPVLAAVIHRQLLFLAVLGTGVLVGILCSTHLLERAMNRHPQPTYLVITGFVVAALRDVYPGPPARGWETLWCIAALLLGYTVISRLSRRWGH